MMMSGDRPGGGTGNGDRPPYPAAAPPGPPPPSSFKNRSSNILIWTDREQRDIFSMVLDRRIAYLRENSCPVLSECIFTFKKQGINEADTVVIAAKRHFPYGGKESGKTWLLIIPGQVTIKSKYNTNRLHQS